MTVETRGATYWVEKMGGIDMPVLGSVLQELNELTGNDDTEVNHLAEVILKDPNLTSQVLRIANSVTYNPASYPINTVSRAIILIGFQGVRAICVSVMIIDSLLGKNPRELLMKQMAQSLHCAVQARNLFRSKRDVVREEVFIAGLLFHLAELVFWSIGGEKADQLEGLLGNSAVSDREAMEEVMGCSFKVVTRGLADLWNLGETLEGAVSGSQNANPKVTAVRLAEEISQAALCGWSSQEMEAVVSRVATFTGETLEEARTRLEDSAREAAGMAVTYGANRVSHLIPQKRRQDTSTEAEMQPEIAVPESPLSPMKPDPQVQLNVLRDLSNAVLEKLDVNVIFQMTTEGLHRGVGLERVVLGIVMKDVVNAKYVLAKGAEDWRQSFRFPCGCDGLNLFSEVARQQRPMWVSRQVMLQKTSLFTPDMKKVLGFLPCLVGGVHLGPRCIAMLYADRGESGAELSDEHYQSFCHFINQAEVALKAISTRQRQR